MKELENPNLPLPIGLGTCRDCGQTFAFNISQYRQMGFADAPTHCPKCRDLKDERPDVTLSRREIFDVICRIASLPDEWQRAEAKAPGRGHNKARPAWRMVIKGERFGADWRGRIDLWATALSPPKPGDVVRLVEMVVTKQIALHAWSREILEHGRVSGERQIALQDAFDAEGLLLPGCRVAEEVRRYARLVPAEKGDPEGRELVWAVAHTKTTLKGYGRQYHAALEGEPLWFKEVRGGVRSGREHTAAWLAVVDADHSIRTIHREGGAEEVMMLPAGVEVLEALER